MSDERRISRRSFVDWLLTGGLIAWAIGFVAPVLSYVWPAQRRGPSTQTVSAGKASGFKDWESKMVAVSGHPVLVFRTPQGFRAFSAICSHLGCIVAWNEAHHDIECPCHAGVFDTNGKVVSGPPPRPLSEYSVVVVNGEVMVKTA